MAAVGAMFRTKSNFFEITERERERESWATYMGGFCGLGPWGLDKSRSTNCGPYEDCVWLDPPRGGQESRRRPTWIKGRACKRVPEVGRSGQGTLHAWAWIRFIAHPKIKRLEIM